MLSRFVIFLIYLLFLFDAGLFVMYTFYVGEEMMSITLLIGIASGWFARTLWED